MHAPPEKLVSELSQHLTCVACKAIAYSPYIICQNDHLACKVCLKLYLSGTEAHCPCCQQPVVITEDPYGEVDALLGLYYSTGTVSKPLKRCESSLTEVTVEMSQKDNFWDGDLSDISDTELDLPDPNSFLELTSSPEMPDGKRAQVKRKQDRETTPTTGGTELTSPAKKARASAKTAKPSSSQPSSASIVKSDLTAINNEGSFAKEAQTKTNSRQSASALPTSDTETSASLSLITTGLTDAQLKRLRKSAAQLSDCLSVPIAVHTEVSCSDHKLPLYTHLVTSVGKDGRTARTYKYLAGIASGAQAVKVEWLFDSAKRGTLVPVDGYLITGDTAMRGCSLVSKMERGKLLAGYNVCVWKGKWDAGSAHTHEELLSLICTLGAKLIDKVSKVDITASDDAVVDIGSSAAKFAATVPVTYRDMFTKPTHSTRAIILVDPDTIKGTKGHSVLDDITRQTAGAYPCRTKSWLFDCISANKVI